MSADGGPAFPSRETNDTYNDQQGMTLRDYFAAKAMAAFYSSPHLAAVNPDRLAEESYIVADAMLKARQT